MRAARPVRSLVPAALLALSLLPSTVEADSRPTSGDMSILSGRTLGNGEMVLAAGVGWPGLWVELVTAPSSTLNVGFRGGVLYGSPVMGLGSSVGGELSVPIRHHLLGKGKLDLSLLAEPRFFLGEGSVAGQEGFFADDFGWGGQLELGILSGLHVSEAVTLTLGAVGGPGYVDVPDSTDGQHLVGTAAVLLGLEALMSRDTMLFAEVRGGWGFAPDDLFDGHEILRLSLGIAYLM